MAITIAATAASLNQFHSTFNNDIIQTMRQGLEFESRPDIQAVPAEHTYSAPNVSLSDLVQAYQWQFTPNNSETFDSVENVLQPIKVDILYTAEQLEKFYDKWQTNWFELGKNPLEWTFPRYMWEMVILPKVIEEINLNSWKGEYSAPTPGSAGNSINSVDGYAKKIADAITAGNLTPLATGPLLANTMVDQVEGFCDAIPTPYRDQPGFIYMSKTNAKKYFRDYRGLFGFGAGVGTNQNEDLRVDMTNKNVVGIAAMEGSDRIFFSPATTGNIIYGTKRGMPLLPVIRWEPHERTIKGFAEFYRFYGFEYWGHLFVNDQA
jgi:hypothetical protein